MLTTNDSCKLNFFLPDVKFIILFDNTLIPEVKTTFKDGVEMVSCSSNANHRRIWLFMHHGVLFGIFNILLLNIGVFSFTLE